MSSNDYTREINGRTFGRGLENGYTGGVIIKTSGALDIVVSELPNRNAGQKIGNRPIRRVSHSLSRIVRPDMAVVIITVSPPGPSMISIYEREIKIQNVAVFAKGVSRRTVTATNTRFSNVRYYIFVNRSSRLYTPATRRNLFIKLYEIQTR